MNTVVDQYGPSELKVLKQPLIVNELTIVICEWGAIWKQLFISHDPNFNIIQKYINNLIKYRSTLLNYSTNQWILVDELKVIKQLAAFYIDNGNKLLRLDMVVRDEHGNVLNPFHTPTVQLYKYHETSTKQISKSFTIGKLRKSMNQNHHYYVYLPIQYEYQQSIKLLNNVDLVRKMSIHQVMSLEKIKHEIRLMLVNGEFSEGDKVLNCLSWKSSPQNLLESLSTLKKLDIDLLFMFLHDILDALFKIFKHNPITTIFDNTVFDCLLYIIDLISDEKYQNFLPILDIYINKHFDQNLAHVKLMAILKCYLSSSTDQINNDNILITIKSLKYIVKFITKSKLLSSELIQGDEYEIFEKSLYEILKLASNLMCRVMTSVDKEYLLSVCLEYMPKSIPDIITIFSATQLSLLLAENVGNLSATSLVKQKLIYMSDIVHSQLFLNAECRSILLPRIVVKIVDFLLFPENTNYTSMCVVLLGDIMDLLYAADSESTFNDITKIMITGLKVVIQVIVKVMVHKDDSVRYYVSLLLSILRQMTDLHYKIYIDHFKAKTELLDFLNNILIIFKDLVSESVYPSTWNKMIMIQNSVILKYLRYFSHSIQEYFLKEIDYKVWTNFFHCAFTFMAQPTLQQEQFSSIKYSQIFSMYTDMRIESGTLIRTMWSQLGMHKIYFMSDMVAIFLEMSLISNNELRKTTIPIFYDMMQCEFYSYTNINANIEDLSNIKGKFNVFQNQMIANLDRLVVGGRGDEQFKELFKSIMLKYCESNSTMRDQGVQFVEIFTNLLECLLDYQTTVNDENKENKIHCTVNLLNLYSDLQHVELIVSYVNILCSLHLECDNFTEAAFTLRVHSELLSWSNDPIPYLLRSPLRYPLSETQSQLKKALYNDIIDYFNKGKMWECAVIMCKRLISHCENETYDYIHLSSLLQYMSNFYAKILKEVRTEPGYYRIAYYGKGFPLYLQNKVYIYRGKECECISDFSKRILDQFPDATQTYTSKPVTEITQSTNQCMFFHMLIVFFNFVSTLINAGIQINKVEPMTPENYDHYSSNFNKEEILQHYRVNHIQKFKYSIKSNRVDPGINLNSRNEFINSWIKCTVMETTYSLPNIVRWSPVKSSHTIEISPLNNAIQVMQKKNNSLKESILALTNDPKFGLEPLSRDLDGILNASVMGGIPMYEQAFFTSEYLMNHKEEEELINVLKDLVAFQILLLDIVVKLHRYRAPQSHYEDCFLKMKIRFEENYGKKSTELCT